MYGGNTEKDRWTSMMHGVREGFLEEMLPDLSLEWLAAATQEQRGKEEGRELQGTELHKSVVTCS